ncbi:MAG: hypothetical protein H0T46_25730 [Deltaproteobacteria bacterium]|nr:hypothetical protein [Deltaproteobacteria bacterium]
MRASSVLVALLVAACGGDSDPSATTDASAGADANADAANDAGTSNLEQGLFLATADRRGPIEWIPVDDAGIHPRVTLVTGIDAALRQSVWGFSDDGTWLFYGLDNQASTSGSLWVRHLDAEPQRVDNASKPYWSGLTWTNDKLFFVGGSEVAYGVDLPATGVASTATQVSRAGKRVFSVPIAASGDYVAMHYYGFQIPIVRAVQAMNALGVDKSECCAFGYYWDLSPRWGHVSDRELMVAGADYDHRDLSIAGINDTSPTTVHNPPQHGGLSVVHGSWSHDDRFIGYTVKKTIQNFSQHLYIADVSSTPQRVEVTTVHTNNVQWRPGTNARHVAYSEYPQDGAQQRVLLGTVETNPLRVTTRPIIEYATSPIHLINYEWNADGTAILHHGGATGEYAVTFIDAAGTPTRVPLGLFFRDPDSTRWTIPYLGWSKDGRRLIVRTNTGHSIASIDVATKQVTAPIALPVEIDFAWWDRRLATP